MNEQDIHSAWNSGANRLDRAAALQLKDELVRRLRRQRWRELAWLAWTCLLLTVLSALLVPWLVFHGRFDPRTDWVLVPLLGLPWGFAIHFVRQFRRRRAAAARAALSIQDALRAAEAENRAAAATLRRVALLQGLFALLLPVAIHQLHAAGKVSGRELGQMAFLFGGILAGGAAFVGLKYFREVRPEGARLAGLLESYR
ncbi:MAG TPA: hypothetical protein VEB66_06070 [Opitutaceae bacterium]|nr:hypothetical protein [Opitutaceae bacterium]